MLVLGFDWCITDFHDLTDRNHFCMFLGFGEENLRLRSLERCERNMVFLHSFFFTTTDLSGVGRVMISKVLQLGKPWNPSSVDLMLTLMQFSCLNTLNTDRFPLQKQVFLKYYKISWSWVRTGTMCRLNSTASFIASRERERSCHPAQRSDASIKVQLINVLIINISLIWRVQKFSHNNFIVSFSSEGTYKYMIIK